MSIAYGSAGTSANVNSAFMSRTTDTGTSGAIDQTNATDSTTPTTGAIKTAGGVGIAKKLNVGETITSQGAVIVADQTQSTNTVTGSITTAGGLGVVKNANIGGNLSVTGSAQASNLSGTNTGDVTLAAIGAVPNANGASLSGQVLNLQPADATNGGVLTYGSQTIGGLKTFNDGLVINNGLTVNGTLTTINTTDLEITDQTILINKGGNDASSEGAGVQVKRTTTDALFAFKNSLVSKWEIGLVGAMYEVLISGLAQTISGVKTFANNLVMQALMILSSENNAQSGSDIALTLPTKIKVDLTNAALVSIQTIVAGAANQLLIITNRTGVAVDIKNEAGATAADRILTGSGADLTLEINASLFLVYNDNSSRWMIVGGSGGGGFSNTITDDLTLTASDTIAIDTSTMFQTFRVQGNAAAISLSTTPFGATPPPDAAIIYLIGNHDTNTVTIAQNDAADGCLMDGDVILAKGQTLGLMYSSSLDRYVRL